MTQPATLITGTTGFVGSELLSALSSTRTLARIVGRLPVLALPSWRSSRTQPIAIGDVIDALVAAPDVAPGTYEVGGADELSIEEMCEVIADLHGRRRLAVALPFASSSRRGKRPVRRLRNHAPTRTGRLKVPAAGSVSAS